MKILKYVSRILIGLVFTYSGFVKLVDPLGSAYKFVDYFTAFGWNFLDPIAEPLSIIQNAAEMLIGICLVLGVSTPLASLGALIFMAIFTPLTLYSALYNPVHDCGCFGEALILTNWQTFWKNVVIDVFVVYLFVVRKSFHSFINKLTNNIVAVVLACLTLGFGIYSLNSLPMVDFRPYKIGNNMPDLMVMPEGEQPDVYAVDYNIKNLESGNVETISSEEYLKQEKYWDTEKYEIVEIGEESYLYKKGYTPPIHDLAIETIEAVEITGYPVGEDIVEDVLADEKPNLWLVTYSLEKANGEALQEANAFYEYAQDKGYKFYALTGTAITEVDNVKRELDLQYTFYNTDEITLKTIVRSNPGLVLVKGGVVLGKWHHNDYPSIDELNELTEN